ncbi:2-aminomuconic semialdehyde dehydrogenase isoform X5 [Narcine bancroftii]|uniref:2-aminomuconic semialdehyde dehydrogenase isoform X5 n=1 Tax=Narcine bancroftii TaxID=1343680 RepID=UPI00383165EC
MPKMAHQRTHLVLENYIGGKFVPCSRHIDSYDPSSGDVYCRVPDSGKEEVDAAVNAAKEAFPGWSARSPLQRSQILHKLADLMEAHLEEFAQAESKDQEMVHMDCTLFTTRTPVGVGIPAGVVNIVCGTGPKAGAAIVSHPDVPLISFTGSTLAAQHIREQSAPYCKKLSLELGGKNPAIIFDDANLDESIPTTVRSSFTNQGEVCLCTSRIFVQKNIYSEFLEKFVEGARKWKVGIPSDPTANMGALISREHLEKVKSYINLAKNEGAKILCGEGIDSLNIPEKNRTGYFLLPTVITEIMDSSRCMQEEIFGPVTCVVPFETEEEVIQRANNVKYGLAATVWSRDVGRVHRVAKKLHTGMVWTNCWLIRDLNLPFGGMKASGVGREGAKDSFEFFTEVKTITIKH